MSYARDNIRGLRGYEPGEQPQAGKFIKLNTNENPYPPSPRVLQAVRAALENGLSRYPDATAATFRQRAADIFAVDPEWILCGNGSDDLLTILTRTFVSEGMLLRLPYPSYVLYRTLAEIQGARYQEVTFRRDWGLPDGFAAAETGLRLAFLPNPNSPSGTVIDRDTICELAEKLPCPLIIDEAYADFASENCVELVAENAKIIVTRSLSKSYGLAGLRFGFLIAQPEMIEQLRKVKDSYNCDALAIAGATAAIDDQAWLQENRARILQTRGRMTEELERLGFSVVPSQANFVWCTRSDRTVRPIYEKLKSERILVRYMHYPEWGEGLRISVGTDDQIDACVQMLGEIV